VADSLVEQLGLLGVLIAGAVPWLEAVVVIPVGILLGLPVVWTVVFALVGNVATIVLFAAGSERIVSAMARRREKRRKPRQDDRRAFLCGTGTWGWLSWGRYSLVPSSRQLSPSRWGSVCGGRVWCSRLGRLRGEC
jgi:hypothetical protein